MSGRRNTTSSLCWCLPEGPCGPVGQGARPWHSWASGQHAWRHTFLALPPGMPSHDTCGRVLARLHPRRLPECLLSSTRAVAQLTQETLVSLDGKTVQAACARATAASPLPMLAAGCSEHGGLVMGPTRTDSQSHAIPAIPDLRPWLASQGGLVTSDARGCQTAIAARMQAPGGDAL